ncbi:hypothetical protein [Cellvibrio sp. pealriver]|uniref:hypothetical protein n=1 Tax=Cellvibrio sp. pealriver TaxID=1622269 RepID=UPI000A506883|nr:hypothetical protein [Cellvibrio sp. pealriver]
MSSAIDVIENLNILTSHIKVSEGEYFRVYSDPLGIPTIGYGYALAIKGEDGRWKYY